MIDTGGGKAYSFSHEKELLFFFKHFLADFEIFFACGSSSLTPQTKQRIKFKVEPTGRGHASLHQQETWAMFLIQYRVLFHDSRIVP